MLWASIETPAVPDAAGSGGRRSWPALAGVAGPCRERVTVLTLTTRCALDADVAAALR